MLVRNRAAAGRTIYLLSVLLHSGIDHARVVVGEGSDGCHDRSYNDDDDDDGRDDGASNSSRVLLLVLWMILR